MQRPKDVTRDGAAWGRDVQGIGRNCGKIRIRALLMRSTSKQGREPAAGEGARTICFSSCSLCAKSPESGETGAGMISCHEGCPEGPLG
jgi:hypothetical protein